MFASRRLVQTLVVAVPLLTLCTGCPFRKEKIKIGADGTVLMNLEYGGSPEELERFDALPSDRTGWKTRRTVETETDSEGVTNETVTIHAEQKFEPGAELPSGFVEPGEPLAALALAFPTTVWFEDRLDGRYVYFHRMYTARRWAYVNYWEDVFIDEEIKELSSKPVEALTEKERGQIVEALVAVQSHRQIEFAREGLRTAFPDSPPEYFLFARRAIVDVYERGDRSLKSITGTCAALSEEERNVCFERETDRLFKEASAACLNALRTQAGHDPANLARFEQAYVQARRFYEITNDLGGHAFEIEVAVPGEVIAHNGDELKVGNDGQTVTFQFDGRAFRDRTHELVVVSRITPSSKE